MAKLEEQDLRNYAEIYNLKGKQELYRILKEEGISAPSGVFQRMKKKKGLEYDERSDQFRVLTEHDTFTGKNGEADTMVETIAEAETEQNENEEKNKNAEGTEKKQDQQTEDRDYLECKISESRKDSERMKLANRLLSDRLLELDRYVTLDREVGIVRLNKEAITGAGYRLVIL